MSVGAEVACGRTSAPMARFQTKCSSNVRAGGPTLGNLPFALRILSFALVITVGMASPVNLKRANRSAISSHYVHHGVVLGADVDRLHRPNFLELTREAPPNGNVLHLTGEAPHKGNVLRKLGRQMGILKTKQDRQEELYEELSARGRGSHYKCGVTEVMHSGSDMQEYCPVDCPLFAEVKGNKLHCDFQCVKLSTEDCVAMNPNEPVPDPFLGICRSCRVDGCAECVMDGTDTCARCRMGYTLVDGACNSDTIYIWLGFFSGLFLIVGVVAAWVVSLHLRPETNPTGVKQGLAVRSRGKLHQPPGKREPVPEDQAGDEEAEFRKLNKRVLWPTDTNLLRTNVAGPGLLLQFNFQFVLILWSAGVAIGWFVMAKVVDDELLILGTRETFTAVQNCILVAYGYEKQHEFMWVKASFCFWLYVISFALAILHSIRQLRIFQSMDAEEKTHKDFCAVVSGLPQVSGSEKVESELKDCLKEATGTNLIGVSVCWDYLDKEDQLMTEIEKELFLRESEGPSQPGSPQETPRQPASKTSADSAATDGSYVAADAPVTQRRKSITESVQDGLAPHFSRLFEMVESTFLSPTAQKIIRKGRQAGAARRKEHRHRLEKKAAREAAKAAEQQPLASARSDAPSEPAPTERIEDILLELKSCECAFAVFASEAERDAAVKKAEESGGIQFRGATITLSESKYEPDSVIWTNCACSSWVIKALKILRGFGSILGALAVWIFCFYLPWAYYSMSFSYAHGNEPGLVAGMTFTMLVVAGNALMYFTCSEISYAVGFRYVDHREACYMLLYNFACVFNVVLDLVATYFIARRMMIGTGMRTYTGIPLAEVDSFTETFETYAMQKALGDQLWAYSFPCTFLVPFMLEGIVTIYVPYKLMRLIVGSHPELVGPTAEQYMAATPMDLSRYADVHLNLLLAVLVFFFPGGFTVQMFLAMAISHVVIYTYDHYRVLCSIPTCDFASIMVDWWAQWMLSVPCGLLVACTVFKSNCETGYHCTDGIALVVKCSAAFAIHVIVHTVLLVFVVPLFGKKEVEREPQEDEYKECSKRIAYSWFNTNPIFCLRTQYIYDMDIPCDYCMVGKEHMVRVNEEMGWYYHDEGAGVEDFDHAVEDLKAGFKKLKQGASDAVEKAQLAVKERVSISIEHVKRLPSRLRSSSTIDSNESKERADSKEAEQK